MLDYFEVMTLKVDPRSRSTFVAVLSLLSPTLIFLRGGIRRSLIRFLFGVGFVASRPNFSLGWDPSLPDQISLRGGIQGIFFKKIFSPIDPFIFLCMFIISPMRKIPLFLILRKSGKRKVKGEDVRN